MAKNKTIQELIIEGKSFELVLGKLYRIGADVLEKVGLESLALFLDKFKDYDQREKFLETLYSKIIISETVKDKLEFSVMELRSQEGNIDLSALKAACLKASGEDVYNRSQEEKLPELKILKFEASIKHLEQANKLFQNLLEKDENYKEQTHSIISTINTMITKYGDVETAFTLAQFSLKLRDENFVDGHPDILSALSLLGQLGVSSATAETKIKGLNFAERAYNLSCKENITPDHAEYISQTLKYMSEIHLTLGDRGKSSELLMESKYIHQKFVTPTIIVDKIEEKQEPVKIEENQELVGIEENQAPVKIEEKQELVRIEERTPIITKAITDPKIIIIKQLLQAKVLDKIQEVAAEGKWHKEWGGLGIKIEYGVVGYLNPIFLKNVLGESYSEENYKAALGLCFEAINLGIMGSVEKNPLISAIFCKEYPELIQELLESHPEYFVDGFIIKTSLLNSCLFSQKLFGETIAENGSYNKFFEKAIMSFISDRLQENILTPIKKLTEKTAWSEWHDNKLAVYLNQEYLVTTVLGKNLSKISDVVDIVRILAFKEICEGIISTKSVNFAPIQKFIELYPELNGRIFQDHPEYFENNLVKQICGQAKETYELSAKTIHTSVSVNIEEIDTQLSGENGNIPHINDLN